MRYNAKTNKARRVSAGTPKQYKPRHVVTVDPLASLSTIKTDDRARTASSVLVKRMPDAVYGEHGGGSREEQIGRIQDNILAIENNIEKHKHKAKVARQHGLETKAIHHEQQAEILGKLLTRQEERKAVKLGEITYLAPRKTSINRDKELPTNDRSYAAQLFNKSQLQEMQRLAREYEEEHGIA